jgi:UDP-N-acetylglucosamine 2-epimerase (non-hydrolysing)
MLVQGDTMTTFAAAWAAFLSRIPVGHVEAGLRTGDRHRPFPEEINRVLATRVADLHFAPTETARDALLAEGVAPESVHLTGNTVIDALLQTLGEGYRFRTPVLGGLDSRRRLVLVTAHRRESFGEPMRRIFRAIDHLAGRLDDTDFVLPVHPNPEVRESVRAHLPSLPNVILVDPLEYREFAHLLARCDLVLTDSGGIQEEAPALGKPVLVLREVTERPEGVAAGTARIVGCDPARIIAETERLLTDPAAYGEMSRAVNPYGDGTASRRIADALARKFRDAV